MHQSTTPKSVAVDMPAELESQLDMAVDLVPTTAELATKFPVSRTMTGITAQHRRRLQRRFMSPSPNDPFLVIVGPCCVDDSRQANGDFSIIEYVKRLRQIARRDDVREKLELVVRLPVAKPRTSTGPRGLEETDLETAYKLLALAASLGLPIAMEVMHERHLSRYGNLLSLAWIGARNVEDTLIRHAASHYTDLAILFKNANRPGLDEALNACAAAAASHVVEIERHDGRLMSAVSAGNSATGVVFRGWSGMTRDEYHQMLCVGEPLVVDCSHANADAMSALGRKDPEAQTLALYYAMQARSEGAPIRGVMLESYLLGGCDPRGSVAGISRMDPCLSWQQTEQALLDIVEWL